MIIDSRDHDALNTESLLSHHEPQGVENKSILNAFMNLISDCVDIESVLVVLLGSLNLFLSPRASQ